MEIKNNKLLILILGLLTAFGPISIDLYLPGFIEMAEDLKVPVSSIQYTLSSFFIGLSIGQLIYGPISDRIGRKKPLLFGIALFIITSFLIAVVKDLNSFVALRFVQALGSCVGMVITRAIIRDSFRTKDIAKVFSLIILIMGVTPIFAPIIGSQILVFFNWRVMFVLLGSFGILAFLASALFIKETLVEPVVYRKSFQNYINLFSDKSFIIASLVTGTAMAAMFSYISSSSFVFLELLGATKNQYPLFFGLNAMGFIILSQVNIKLLNHYSIDQILKVAMGLFFFYSLL
ncbi:multidrug effflux MFS transporter, partial [Bacteriovoracaceae bacterium]|nr:multidrug effflux MFS transporter [Bacteriovoracaceae bacterium]